MSATPKKIAQPRNSQPSTLMPSLLTLSVAQPPAVGPPAVALSVVGPSMAGSDSDRLALLGIPPGPDLWVVQVERGPLGPDPRDRGEVVPWRRARGRPLQRVAEAPGVVDLDLLAVLPRLVGVVEAE